MTYGTQRDRVLHVIVGAGNVTHFTNCIRSVQRFDPGEVFAVYNWISSSDKAAIEEEDSQIEGRVSKIILQENEPGKRTGSLYKANNLGLEYARKGFDFVNFIQADMQMMWWDKKFLHRTRAIASEHLERGGKAISFFTQIPVLGKKKSVYEGWDWDEASSTFRTTGFADVCLLPVFDGLNEGFSFSGDEARMSHQHSEHKSPLVYHPYPFLAPIPFPHNVRERQSRRANRSGIPNDDILRINPDFSVDLNADSLHPLVMEDVVFPNGWTCTTPYWPSDTTGTTWLRRRYHSISDDPLSLFEVRKANGQLSRWPFRSSRPGIRRILASLAQLLAEETWHLLTRRLSESHVRSTRRTKISNDDKEG